jgi:hypothetical protein
MKFLSFCLFALRRTVVALPKSQALAQNWVFLLVIISWKHLLVFLYTSIIILESKVFIHDDVSQEHDS